MSEKIKVAFLETHHPHMWSRVAVLPELDDVEILGFYDDDRDTVEKFIKRTGWKFFSSPEELFEANPDVIIVESMDSKMHDYALMSASHAKAILIEKVGAQSPEGVRALAKELEPFHVSIENGFQMNYLPILSKIKEILKSGVLGQLTLARVHGGCPVGCAADPWCNADGLSSGLVWLEGCHMLDIAIDLFGMPKKLVGMLSKLPEGEIVMSKRVGMDLFIGAGNPTQTQIGKLNCEDVGGAVALYDNMMAVFDFTAWEHGGWCEEWKIEFYGTYGTMIAYLLPEKIELRLDRPFGDYSEGTTLIEWPLTTENGDSQMKDAYRRQLLHLIEMSKQNTANQQGMKRTVEVATFAEMMY